MKNFFSFFWQSISNFDFYKKVVNFRPAAVFKYLLILLFIAAILLSFGISKKVHKFVNETGDWAINNLPDIVITNGIVDVNAKMPFKVKKENFEIIIDTTGKTSSLDAAVKQGLLLTKNQLIYKQSEAQTNTYELAKIKNLVLDEQTINRWKKTAFRSVFPLIFAASFLYYAAAKAFQILFFGFLPFIISRVKKRELKYSQALRISAFGLTLPFSLAVIVEIFFFRVRFFAILFILIYAVYLVKGTIANCAKEETEEIKEEEINK